MQLGLGLSLLLTCAGARFACDEQQLGHLLVVGSRGCATALVGTSWLE